MNFEEKLMKIMVVDAFTQIRRIFFKKTQMALLRWYSKSHIVTPFLSARAKPSASTFYQKFHLHNSLLTYS